MTINQAVILTIKIGLGHHIGDLLPSLVVQHQAPKHRLFGLDRLRRGPNIQCGVIKRLILFTHSAHDDRWTKV